MQRLPDPLPADPLPVLREWLDQAGDELRDHTPTAMSLATLGEDGAPSSRMVICRGYDATHGWLVFYTDRESPKGRELDGHARAALVFYWDPFQRQLRVRGPVVRSPASESDAYFSSRPPGAQISARASRQSRPLASRAELVASRDREAALYPDGQAVPRPERWGGYRVWIESVEFWTGMPDRLHDRALYTRKLEPEREGFRAGAWTATRLEP